MRHSIRLHLCWLFVFSAGLQAGEPVAVQKKWVDCSSAHFRFFVEGSERSAKPAVEDFEKFYAILEELSPAAKESQKAPQTTYIYLFAGDRDYEDFKLGLNNAGWFIKRQDGNFLAIQNGLEIAHQIGFHEYSHYFLHLTLPNVPAWLDEGLAEYFSTMEVDGNSVRLGRLNSNRFSVLQVSGLMSLPELASHRTTHEIKEDQQVQRFYASSMITVHYLISGSRKRQFVAYLDNLRKGIPPEVAFQGAFACTVEEMKKEIEDYIKQILSSKIYPMRKVDLQSMHVNLAFSSKPMTKDQICARLGLLLATPSHPNFSKAQNYLQSALTLNPSQPEANFGMGLLKPQNVAPNPAPGSDSTSYLLKAAEGDKDNLAYQFQAGYQLLIGDGEGKNKDLAKAKDCFLRIIKADPRHKGAPSMLLAAFQQDLSGAREALPALEQALQLAPSQPGELQALKGCIGLLYVEFNDREKAVPLLKEALVGSDANMAFNARRALESMADKTAREGLNEAKRLVSIGKASEGMVYLDEALNIAADPALKKRIQNVKDQVNVIIQKEEEATKLAQAAKKAKPQKSPAKRTSK